MGICNKGPTDTFRQYFKLERYIKERMPTGRADDLMGVSKGLWQQLFKEALSQEPAAIVADSTEDVLHKELENLNDQASGARHLGASGRMGSAVANTSRGAPSSTLQMCFAWWPMSVLCNRCKLWRRDNPVNRLNYILNGGDDWYDCSRHQRENRVASCPRAHLPLPDP